MKKQLLICTWLFSIVLLASCAETTTVNESNNAQACNIGAVSLLADFEASRMDECRRIEENSFQIVIKPENTPINPSPWYAFKIIADQPSKVKVAIKIAGKRENRYLPKISTDMKSWHVHEHRYRGKVLTFNVNANQQATYIAGQEVINNQYYVDWAKHLEATSQVKQSKLGESLQGRPIYKIESQGNSGEWLVILGRLHPPEITGALALFPFVETLLANNAFAKNIIY